MKPLARRSFFSNVFPISASLLLIALAGPLPLASAGDPAKPQGKRAKASDGESGNFLLGLLGLSNGQAQSDPAATHQFEKAVTVKSANGKFGVQTFCLDREGRLIALVAPPRYYDSSLKDAVSEVQVLSKTGEPVSQWTVDFHGHSINAGPDGSVIVAGDGKIARFAADGKLLKEIELPHIAELVKDKDGIRKRAEQQVKQQRRNYSTIADQYRRRIKNLEQKSEDELRPSEKRTLEQLRRALKRFESENEEVSGSQLDAMVKSITSRTRIINSVAASDGDVFIVCGESTGYGYSLWRMDREFANPKQVMHGMQGCCGQMDVQAQGNDLLVAENCKHAFARYDRDGKKLGQWGQTSRSGDVKCFGGCCNPMNLCAGPSGDVFTAESEGFVKRFSRDGKFLALVGKRPLAGGCKNVAVAASADGKLVYFCDQPGSQIIILSEKPKAVAQAHSAVN